jgi:hypothetical protein
MIEQGPSEIAALVGALRVRGERLARSASGEAEVAALRYVLAKSWTGHVRDVPKQELAAVVGAEGIGACWIDIDAQPYSYARTE